MTKWSEAKAVLEASAHAAADFIYTEIICRHGCPKIILSDKETHFKNSLIENLLKKINVKHLFSTPYHPQTNGLVERFNRTLCESIAKCIENVTDWNTMIPSVLFAYRISRQSTTQVIPFYLVYGRQGKLPLDVKGNDR